MFCKDLIWHKIKGFTLIQIHKQKKGNIAIKEFKLYFKSTSDMKNYIGKWWNTEQESGL